MAPAAFSFETAVAGTRVPLPETSAEDIVAALCLKEVEGADGKVELADSASLTGCEDTPEGVNGCIKPDWRFTDNVDFTVLLAQRSDGTWSIEAGEVVVDGETVTVDRSPYASPAPADATQSLTIRIIVPTLSAAAEQRLDAELSASDAGFVRHLVERIEAHETQHVCQALHYLDEEAEHLWNFPAAADAPDAGFPTAAAAHGATVQRFVADYEALKDEYHWDNDVFHAVENAFRIDHGYRRITLGQTTYACPQLPVTYDGFVGELVGGEDYPMNRCKDLQVEAFDIAWAGE